MALLTSEIQRMKAELGLNVLTIGAVFYADVTLFFEQVIATYLSAGAATTCATAVTAATAPALVSLTLASVTGFTAGDRIAVDVDSRQERPIVESVSGSTIAVLLSKAHSGTYAVTVEGGEVIVRDCLAQIENVRGAMKRATSRAGIAQVDEVKFFQSTNGKSGAFGDLTNQLAYWRGELASAIGANDLIARMQSGGRGGGGSMIAL